MVVGRVYRYGETAFHPSRCMTSSLMHFDLVVLIFKKKGLTSFTYQNFDIESCCCSDTIRHVVLYV